jgi:hypothetical protein
MVGGFNSYAYNYPGICFTVWMVVVGFLYPAVCDYSANLYFQKTAACCNHG